MKGSSGFNILSAEEPLKKSSEKFGKSKCHRAQFSETLKTAGI